MAASNRNLEASVAEGRFRADLLYRLRVVPVDLPPLRDREDDVRSLALHFLAEFSLAEKREKRLSPRALAFLEDHPFPGNVRELRNAVQHGFILAEDEIDIEHLPSDMTARREARAAGGTAAAQDVEADPGAADSVSVAIPVALADVERRVILATLEHLGGEKSRTAQALGISLKTLYSRLREYSALPNS